jgi:hypothetical protein
LACRHRKHLGSIVQIGPTVKVPWLRKHWLRAARRIIRLCRMRLRLQRCMREYIEGRKQFFFVKKNQKTFVNLNLGWFHGYQPIIENFFLFFLKKKPSSTCLLQNFRPETAKLHPTSPRYRLCNPPHFDVVDTPVRQLQRCPTNCACWRKHPRSAGNH